MLSGHLSWTPVHESEDFWKENAARLNEKDHELLRYILLLIATIHKCLSFCDSILIKLLKESTEPVVLAVAAHDVGQYVKHYDLGKK